MTTIRSNLLSESRLLQSFHHRLPSTQRFPVHVACRPIIAAGHLRSRRHPVIRCECGAIQTPFHAIRTPQNWGIFHVPRNMAYVIERHNNYSTTLVGPGFYSLNPLFYKIAYVHSMEKHTIHIEDQFVPTKDKVNILIEGRVHVQIVDPVRASYEEQDFMLRIIKVTQSSVRTKVENLTLEQLLFEETISLGNNITTSINEVTEDFGLRCLRYEIVNICPPAGATKAVEMRREAEQKKMEAEQKNMTKIAEAKVEGEVALVRAGFTKSFIASTAEDLKGELAFEYAWLRIALQCMDRMSKTGLTGAMMMNPTAMVPMISQAMLIYKQMLDARKLEGSSGNQISSS